MQIVDYTDPAPVLKKWAKTHLLLLDSDHRDSPLSFRNPTSLIVKFSNSLSHDLVLLASLECWIPASSDAKHEERPVKLLEIRPQGRRPFSLTDLVLRMKNAMRGPESFYCIWWLIRSSNVPAACTSSAEIRRRLGINSLGRVWPKSATKSMLRI